MTNAPFMFRSAKESTAAFTGYRPDKIALSSKNPNIENEIRAALKLAVREFYGRGFRYFLSGMAEGFDLWAADEVLSLKNSGEMSDIELVAVVPFRGQSRTYSGDAAALYEKILRHAAETVILSEHYYPECFHRRNDWLVDHSSAVICYYDGQQGGTGYTVSRARRRGLPVFNLLDPVIVL